MELVRKNLRYIIILISIFFILQATLLLYNKYNEYSTPDYNDLLFRYLSVVAVYVLLFYQVYRLRKIKYVISIFLEMLGLAAAVSIFMVAPVLYARTAGIISAEVGYLYIAEVNMLFALFLSITVYMTKHLSYQLAKAIFLFSINTVFIINCAAIAILYSTGFEIGPTVFLHFSWDAVKVGAGEYITILLLMFAALIPVNILFLKIMKTRKDSVINYTIASLAVLAVLANSVVLNFDLYKTKTILPVYSIVDTAVRYSDSGMITLREKYSQLQVSKHEEKVLDELGINISSLTRPEDITMPTAPYNIITIYLESFQLNFTKHFDELYPQLTPNINALSDEYVVYKNFINSVTPTINAMISSQCGADVILSTENFIADNNEILKHDAVAQDLLKDNLVCLSDILHEKGYYQVLMKGANIHFSGKGKFFKSHNYDQTLGQFELNKNNKYKDLNLWGLHDPDLFDEAEALLKELKTKQPFNLTMLTVNSHAPGFEFTGCPLYEEGNLMLNGIHCTDFALGRFLEKLETMDILDNTVVVIVGDHVMFNSPSLQEVFTNTTLSWYGRTYLAIRSPDKELVQQPDIFGITPDLAPTILDLLGFTNMNFISGKSLISERQNYQRITANSFDIIDGKMIPEHVESILNDCPIDDAAKELLTGTGEFTHCQKARAHYIQQKIIYQ